MHQNNSEIFPSFRKIFHTLTPPLCPLCYVTVSEDGILCPSCWPKVNFISEPYCKGCGEPLECSPTEDLLCALCLKDPFAFQEAQGVFYYNATVRPLILRFKYADATHLAAFLARWMAWDENYLKDVDAIIPVPLHWTRLMQRGFNQAALLARHLSLYTKIPFLPHILKRIKATAPQGKMSKERRAQNLRRAFKVPEKYHAKIQGKTILLVDDVMASGATLQFSSKALLTAGAKSVKVKVACKSTR